MEIVHIQKNLNRDFHRLPNNRTFFFTELDVRKKSDPSKKVYRASTFLQPTNEGDLCFMKEWNTWREDVTIHLLTPIRNQFRWMKFLVKMLEETISNAHETNVSDKPLNI